MLWAALATSNTPAHFSFYRSGLFRIRLLQELPNTSAKYIMQQNTANFAESWEKKLAQEYCMVRH